MTGAARGIGRGIVRRLLGDGWSVAAIDRDELSLRATEAALGSDARLLAAVADVGDEAAIVQAIADTVARFGGLDLLVNNAAIADPHAGPLEQLSLERWHELLRVNVDSVFLCSKHAIPHLRARGGSIINLSSTRALQSEPHTEVYSASKGAIMALTHALAISLGPAIRVNAIAPGWIDTRSELPEHVEAPPEPSAADHAQHPVGRIGRPNDVASLVAWLASEEAGFMTGQQLVIDGGMTRKMIYV